MEVHLYTPMLLFYYRLYQEFCFTEGSQGC
jgi:hypothetical protein